MGVYRRKDKEGKHYGPYIVQYPDSINPVTGKAIRKTCVIKGSKELATTVFQAKSVEFERKKYLGLEKKREYTFGELLKWYLKHPKARQKKTYKRDIEMGILLEENFGPRPANGIKPFEIELFMEKMLETKSKRGTPYKKATVNRFFTLMKRIYSLAMRDEMVEKNPCLKVSLLPERNVRDRIVSPGEFEKLKEELPQYALILTLGYHLPMREGEILSLREKQVHFFDNDSDEGYLELYDGETKTGEGRKISYGAEVGSLLRDHLNGMRKRGPENFLFTTGNGNLLGNFRRGFQRACKRAGIEGLCFHDFRHTSITNLRKAGAHTSVIMAMSGHKTMAMFKRYNKVDLDDGREAMRKLETYLSKNRHEAKHLKQREESGIPYCNRTAETLGGPLACA